MKPAPGRFQQFSGEEPEPVQVLPADRFDDRYWIPEGCTDPETRGRRSAAVNGRLSRSCCGWRRRPTAADFHEAAAADDPTDLQMEIVGVLLDEGDAKEITEAFFEGAFTWRRLVRIMIARNGGKPDRNARHVNTWTAENLRRIRPWLLELS